MIRAFAIGVMLNKLLCAQCGTNTHHVYPTYSSVCLQFLIWQHKFFIMVTKYCCWGTCNIDSRYNNKPHMQGIVFFPFPKPTRKLEVCKQWIKSCGRLNSQLSLEKIGRHHFVCSKVNLLGQFYFLLQILLSCQILEICFLLSALCRWKTNWRESLSSCSNYFHINSQGQKMTCFACKAILCKKAQNIFKENR